MRHELVVAGSLAASLAGCTPSPERICRRWNELSATKGPEIDLRACVEELQTLRTESSESYARCARCVTEAGNGVDVGRCEHDCTSNKTFSARKCADDCHAKESACSSACSAADLDTLNACVDGCFAARDACTRACGP